MLLKRFSSCQDRCCEPLLIKPPAHRHLSPATLAFLAKRLASTVTRLKWVGCKEIPGAPDETLLSPPTDPEVGGRRSAPRNDEENGGRRPVLAKIRKRCGALAVLELSAGSAEGRAPDACASLNPRKRLSTAWHGAASACDRPSCRAVRVPRSGSKPSPGTFTEDPYAVSPAMLCVLAAEP